MTQNESRNVSTAHVPQSKPQPPIKAPANVAAEGYSRQMKLDRIMIVIVTLTVATTCFLISSSEGTEVGHQPWSQGSILQLLAELMAMNYQYPTARGVEIKWLTHGLGAAVALLVAAAAWFLATRREDESFVATTASPPNRKIRSPDGHPRSTLASALSPATAAQIVMVLFAGWMMLSALWAPWPAAALGEGIRQLMITLWAIALARTLSQRGVRNVATALVIVLTLMAGVGIWYYIERNPFQRLKFPIGNPIFLAACLLPGITLSIAALLNCLIDPFGKQPSSKNATAKTTGTQNDSTFHPYRVYIAAAVALVILFWAWRLTESRSPVLGLVVGIAATIIIAVRGRWRWLLMGTALLVLLAGGWWANAQMSTLEGGRGANIRLRLYSWQYAMDLFLEEPIIGQGQGGYLLLAQQMSRADAERDPAAFPGPLLGHAHNEWLQIMADLGAVGIGLCLAAVGFTLRAATSALRALSRARDRWCLLGLLAAFIAILAEEGADVALRMPGLPVIFYTIIGLIWAMARDTNTGLTVKHKTHSKPIRVIGLAAATVGAIAIATVAARDWRGALADPEVTTYVEKKKWDQAIQRGQQAASCRLVVESRLAAEFQTIQAAREAAREQLRRLHEMLTRPIESARSQIAITRLAQEDSARFTIYFDMAVHKGTQMLERIPTYPFVAGWIADLWLMRQDMEKLEQRLGLRGTSGNYIAQARQALQQEYLRDPLNVEAGLRLLELSADQPLDNRIDILRKLLRTGSISQQQLRQTETVLMGYLQEPGFTTTIAKLLAQADRALSETNAANWPDGYAPETFRLAALAHMLQRRFDLAAALAQRSIVLYKTIRQQFPHAVAYAHLDEARYLLLAYPNEPKRAVLACQEAIANWPPVRLRESELVPVRHLLATYLLATGDEVAARNELRRAKPSVSEAERTANIGKLLADLCQYFAGLSLNQRPAAYPTWVAQSLRLAPNWPGAHLVAAGLAFDRNNNTQAIHHLESTERLINNPAHMARILQSFLARTPHNQALRDFAATRLKQLPPRNQPPPTNTQPDTSASAPATAPAKPPMMNVPTSQPTGPVNNHPQP